MLSYECYDTNEFRYTGDSAIAALGSTEMIDGTSGNQPREMKILNNLELMHEIGIYGKQSAAYFQSLTCQTEFDGNILFNGPRNGLNHNDNFGGGNVLKNNLAFNFVRETADCGPFNFFDRVPYITRLYDTELKHLHFYLRCHTFHIITLSQITTPYILSITTMVHATGWAQIIS